MVYKTFHSLGHQSCGLVDVLVKTDSVIFNEHIQVNQM